MIIVTTTRQREDQIAAVKARGLDALGITEAAARLARRHAGGNGSPSKRSRPAACWCWIGTLAQPLVVMPLAVAVRVGRPDRGSDRR